MTVADVSARIHEIRTQFAFLTVPTPQASVFADTLGRVSASGTTSPVAVAGPEPGGVVAGRSSTRSSGPEGTGVGRLPAGTPYATTFQRAEAKYGVDAELLATVAKHESAFDPRAVSPAGARGLMQLMPATARGLGVDDPFDPEQAIDGAARLLRDLHREFGRTDLALAAYNAGPGAVHKYSGIPPYRETQNYVRAIMSDLGDL